MMPIPHRSPAFTSFIPPTVFIVNVADGLNCFRHSSSSRTYSFIFLSYSASRFAYASGNSSFFFPGGLGAWGLRRIESGVTAPIGGAGIGTLPDATGCSWSCSGDTGVIVGPFFFFGSPGFPVAGTGTPGTGRAPCPCFKRSSAAARSSASPASAGVRSNSANAFGTLIRASFVAFSSGVIVAGSPFRYRISSLTPNIAVVATLLPGT